MKAPTTDIPLAPEHDPVADNKIRKLVHVIYRLAYLAHLGVNFLFRPKTRGAYVAVWLDKKLLLIRNSYKPGYTLPCGGIEKSESPIEAAQRELNEEVGLNLPVSKLKLAAKKIVYSEFKQDHIYLYETHLKRQPDLKLEGYEVVWSKFMRPQDALKLPLSPAIRDYLAEHANATAG